ncbi:MAG: O-antigen ligase family protein [Candidatus Melainabacteria bacterium]
MQKILGKQLIHPWRVWGLVLLAGVALPFVLFGIASQYDVSLPGVFHDTRWLALLIGVPVLLLMVGYYYETISTRPPVFWLYFFAVFWQVVTFISRWLINTVGLDLHLRMLLILLLGIPLVIYVFRFGGELLKRLPPIGFFLLFLSVVGFYYFFFNADVQDLSIYREGSWLQGNLSIEKIICFYFTLCELVITPVCVWRHSDPYKLFDRLNFCLMTFVSLASIVFLIGFPFHFFSVELDGFTRTEGFLGHPNLYSHQMGIYVVYLLGLFCYYQNENAHRMPRWFLYGAVGINLIGFLIGFSKTGFIALGLAALWVLGTNLAIPAVRRAFWSAGAVILLLLMAGIGAFEAISGKRVLQIITDRINDPQSLNTRMGRWNMLLGSMDFSHLLTGHGHTAASAMIRLQNFNDLEGKPVLLVHNGYLELLYDYGIWGLTHFLVIISIVISAYKKWFTHKNMSNWALYMTVIGLVIYYLIVMMCDEILYMSYSSNLFWMLTILMLSLPKKTVQLQEIYA